MLSWLYLAIERWARATSARQAKAAGCIPLWYIRKLSEAKLLRLLRYVYRNCPAQRKAWNQAGLKLGDIRSPHILQHIPFTTGPELAERPEDYFCVAPEKLIHIITTSSTTGLEKRIYFTADDFKHQIRMISTSLRRFPNATRAAAMYLVHNPTWSVGFVMRQAIAEAGMLGFLSGVHRSVQQQIDLLKKYRINLLMTTPVHLSRLTWETTENLRDLGLLYIQLGTQPWSEDFRRRMQQKWGAKLIDAYGMNECACGIAAECIYQNGLHVGELDYWLEVIDPRTGKVLPEGHEGELVITTLSRRGMPLVRYRTGDLTSLLPRNGRCQCGMGLRKMGRIRGRVDDMLIVGDGINLYPDEIDKALFSVPGVTDYQVVIGKDGYKDLMDVTIEANRPPEQLRKAISKVLLGVRSIGISCRVSRTMRLGRIDVVRLGSLSPGRPKTVRIVDRRDKAAPAQATRPGD